MKIGIVGCSGFVGTELKAFFEGLSHEVVAIRVRDNTEVEVLVSMLEGLDGLVNLAGVSIFGRWSEAYKQSLYTSRIETTRKLVDAMGRCEKKPKAFISSSAVGIYPDDVVSDEDSGELSNSFLAKICKDWEAEAMKAEAGGINTMIFRSGVVVGRSGGMLQKMWLPFSLGFGGIIGSGKQPLSWIHIQDLKGVYEKALTEEGMQGVYNLCAPLPTNNLELTRALGTLMKRPTLFPVPAWVLKLLFGEGSSFMLEGQRVHPKRLLEAGFEFKYPDIDKALKSFF